MLTFLTRQNIVIFKVIMFMFVYGDAKCKRPGSIVKDIYRTVGRPIIISILVYFDLILIKAGVSGEKQKWFYLLKCLSHLPAPFLSHQVINMPSMTSYHHTLS